MKKILITAPIYQKIQFFKEYLWSLNRLEIPENYEIHKYFYLYKTENLKKMLSNNEYEIFDSRITFKKDGMDYVWNQKDYDAISIMRTKGLEKAREENYDYVFSVNGDVILHKNTLIDLLSENKDIISKVYWTPLNNSLESIPNCYDERNQNHIIVYKNNLTHYKFIGTYETGVTSGATLISSKIFNNSLINYYPIKILSSSYFEDYSFCVKCKCVFPDIKFYINTLHPAKRLTTLEDYNNWIKWEKKEWK